MKDLETTKVSSLIDRTECNVCGTIIDDEDPALVETRRPCPSCGSQARKFYRVVSATMSANVEALAEKLPVSTGLLLQTLVLAGRKTDEGQLVEAVALPWFEIIDLLERDPSAAHEIGARKWEEIIAGAYKKAGFDEVTLTPRSGDYGRDIIAIKRGIGIVRVIDQVKAYGPGHLVTANDVRALVGVLQGDGASKGFLTTTSDFAPKLREDPLITPFFPSRLELINGKALLMRLAELKLKTR